MELIFGFKETSFEITGSKVYEQDVLFIDIHKCTTRISRADQDGRETARVDGAITVFSQENRLTYGFFNKRIERADPALTKNLFFYDIDVDVASSEARLQNLHERRCSFVFLYDAQYDPARGSLTTLVLHDEGE